MSSKDNKKDILSSEKQKKREDEDKVAVDSFLTEIESDIRDEQLQKLWLRYRSLFFVSLTILVIGVASYQFWIKLEQDRVTQQATVYDNALTLMNAEDFESALELFSQVSNDGGNYAALADLQRASILIDQGKKENALDIYRSLADKRNISDKFRNLALLLEVLHGVELEDTEYLSNIITDLTNPSNPFVYNALELKALIQYKNGNINGAIDTLKNLIKDERTPVDILQRANEVITVLESGYSNF